ncbi:NAD-dependent deacetylase [Xanthomonas arboricola pv. pruni str. MAFF 311562]|uniref:NAD-dependent deacetylase n=1 Tax=Xanthomonas arboricola pv. pruni str. MAFF 311562 TaxID=1414836 RepID=W4S0R6_9XANT|nr:NAD-dependent deacetylase [Xanthomonas arboricola pv. pruni str. MAFF 311562]
MVGSSLMVYSGFRFVQTAARNGLPIAALNFGRTRADELLSLKVEQSCAQALAFLHTPFASTTPVRVRHDAVIHRSGCAHARGAVQWASPCHLWMPP